MLGIPCSQDALRAPPGAEQSMPWAVHASKVPRMLGCSGPRWVGMEILVAYGTDMTWLLELSFPGFLPLKKKRLFCIWSSDLGLLQGPNLTFAEENPALSETISWTVQDKTSHTWCSIGKTKSSCFFNCKKNAFLATIPPDQLPHQHLVTPPQNVEPLFLTARTCSHPATWLQISSESMRKRESFQKIVATCCHMAFSKNFGTSAVSPMFLVDLPAVSAATVAALVDWCPPRVTRRTRRPFRSQSATDEPRNELVAVRAKRPGIGRGPQL